MRSRSALTILTLATLALAGATASAATTMHLRLTRSAPDKDAALATAPAEIRLWFSLPPEVGISRIHLQDAEGNEVELGDLEAGEENSLVATVLGDMAAGAYEVTWRTSSGDGHPISGTYGFVVAATD
jgi:hypothetical protein